MRQHAIRALKRAALVALVLAVFGFGLGQVGMMWAKGLGGSIETSGDDLRWIFAYRMAIVGVVLLIVCESIAFALRRKRSVPPTASPTLNPPGSPGSP